MNAQLADLYRSFFRHATVSPALASRLSCPLLVSVGSRWEHAECRLLVVGQETFGWTWEPGQYYPWPSGPLRTLDATLAEPRFVEALMGGYSAFEFAKNEPKNVNSPFWRAFRHLRSVIDRDASGDVLWTNVFRCDLEGGSIMNGATAAERQEVYAVQRGLLAGEIGVLQPSGVLFLTGPNYDEALSDEFPAVALNQIDSRPARQLARVQHARLPPLSFRMYHPGYLLRSGKWSWLDDIASRVCSDSHSVPRTDLPRAW